MSSFEVAAPYVISGDVPGLMQRWTNQNGLTLPSQTFFDAQADELCAQVSIAANSLVEFVPFDEIQKGLHQEIESSEVPVLSLDRAYIDESHRRVAAFIDITRAVHLDLTNAGTHHRPGQLTKFEQLEKLSSSLPVGQPVALCDDVIFSGGILEIVDDLATLQHPVQKVIAGIGIDEGLNKIEEAGIATSCVRRYQEVKDEICERDFMVGVPMSGRTVLDGAGGYVSAPYILPYGNPVAWATMDESKVRDFSVACLRLSAEMYEEISRLSNRQVLVGDLARRVLGLALDQPAAIELYKQAEQL